MTTHPTFTPSAIAPDELDAITVGREALFEMLVHRISSAVRSGSRPHTLLVAPRGGGKTHTLHVAVNRSLSDPEVAKQVLPVMIPEDALAIGSYLDLLVEIARTIDGEVGETARRFRRDKDAIGIEQSITDAAAGRMILLAIENLDRVFDSIGSTGQGSLRAWIETSTDVMIFATAPMLFSGVASRSYPWYGSFMVETLLEFSVEEGAVMLRLAAQRRGDEHLASFVNSPEGLDRLQVVHRLAGGSPRLWHILSDCIDVKSLDALVPAVEALLDRLAPYYQQQLWQLPTGEQRLVVELARGWEPKTVSDLAAAVGVSNQSAATALRRLTTSRWVTSAKSPTGDKRASWYDLTEPLLRYHLHYREDRGKPLRLIVEFLRSFYSRERLLSELAEARPESPLEHHLQRALQRHDEVWSPGVFVGDIDDVLTHMRVWIGDDTHGISRVGIALETVLCAAYQRPARRTAPNDIAALVSNAETAARNHDGPPPQRLHAGLARLACGPWTEVESDAFVAFGALADTADPHRIGRLSSSAAVRQRHTSAPAIFLRHMDALLLDDATAIRRLNGLIDDLDEAQAPATTKVFTWRMWLQRIVRVATQPPRRRADVAASTALVLNLEEDLNSPDQLPRILDALTPETGAATAGVLMVANMRGQIVLPPEWHPQRLVDSDYASLVTDVVMRYFIDEES
jgi:hypothetical protein